MSRYLTICLIFLLGLAACATETESEPVDVQSRSAELSVDSKAESDEIKAKRAWTQRDKPVMQPVDWVAAGQEPKLDLSRLPEAERSKLTDVDLPALIPDVDFLSSAFIVAGPHWYSARMKAADHSIYIQGNRAAFQHDFGLTDEQKKSVENFTVYRTHAIPTLAFNRFGVAYTIDVECMRPLEDRRCTDDDYVLSIAEGLQLAGGAR